MWAWCVAAVAILVAAGGIGYGVLRSPKAPTRPVVRLSFECPIESDPEAMLRPRVAIAPDGSLIALQGDDDESTILLRRMDQTELRELDLPWPAELLTWTPDSRWVVARRGEELWRASPTGESPRLICRLPEEGWMWSNCVRPLDEQTLIVGMVRGLYTVPIDGGDPHLVLKDDGDDMLVQPTPIPDTDAVLFLEINSGRVEMLRRGARSVVFDFGGDRLGRLSYAPTGHLFVSLSEGSRDRGTWMIPFDVESLTATGDPVRILPRSAFSVSHEGTLVYAPYVSVPLEERSLVWVTREGVVEGTIGAPLRAASEPALSPDGKRIALTGLSSSSQNPLRSDWDLYIVDVATGSRAVLRDALGHEHYPFWRSDNETVVFSTWNAGIRHAREVAASGDRAPVKLAESALIAMPTRDDRYLLIAYDGIRYITTESGEERVFSENSARSFDVTSDGRWLAYYRSRDDGITLQRFPEGGALTTITKEDARAVRWNTDDTELYYWVEDELHAVAVDLSRPQPVVGTPERLFNAQEVGVRPGFDYDIASDGRLLMVKTPEDAAPSPKSMTVHVVEQWAREYTQGR